MVMCPEFLIQVIDVVEVGVEGRVERGWGSLLAFPL